MRHSLENHPGNTGRHAGILIPLFSMRDGRDWGIGDFDSLVKWIEWTSAHKTKILQILPIHEMPPGDDCPYKALTAFALDPVYISIDSIEDVRASESVCAYISGEDIRKEVDRLRRSAAVLYAPVKDLKYKIMWMAFQHFLKEEWAKNSARAGEFRQFRKDAAYWLDDYAVFRTMKDLNGWRSWTEWDHPIKSRDGKALASFREKHETQVMFFEYLQWQADIQWKKVRATAASKKVWLFGDLPFMVNQESADVWGYQDVFDISKDIGAPPDAFSTEGQRWGLPAYNWPRLEETNFAWWRKRMRRAREIYDLIRLDHLVGFFRTWVAHQDRSRPPHFDIDGDEPQRLRGERFLKMVVEESGHSLPIAEDLGLIPPFVRQTLTALHIPGYKVIRWEQDWKGTGEYYDLRSYQKVSLATTSTHDMDTFRDWWENTTTEERSKAWRMMTGESGHHPRWSEKVCFAMVRKMLESGSSIALFPLQDIIGTSERINTPGTVGEHNWTYKVPLTVEKMSGASKYRDYLDFYVKSVVETGRGLA